MGGHQGSCFRRARSETLSSKLKYMKDCLLTVTKLALRQPAFAGTHATVQKARCSQLEISCCNSDRNPGPIDLLLQPTCKVKLLLRPPHLGNDHELVQRQSLQWPAQWSYRPEPQRCRCNLFSILARGIVAFLVFSCTQPSKHLQATASKH